MARRLTQGSARVASCLVMMAFLAAPAPAEASCVAELVREARAHETAHEDDLAARRYSEALALDPTCGDAYLGLGALRLRLGDPREAERVFSTALSHDPDLREALVGRARARRALGALAAADGDLEAYAEIGADPAILRELAGWYAEEGNSLAQLEVWRRILALAERVPHVRDVWAEARVTVHALELLVGTLDPVRAPATPSAERRGMARMQRRR